MSSIGELTTPVLAFIWEQRVLLGIVGAVAVLAVLGIGWRRGWHHVAGRHRVATTVLAVAGLAIALPVGWYLFSPLVIRTELVEDAVPGVAAAAPTPPAGPLATSAPRPSSTDPAGSSPIALAPPALADRRGQFQGADEFHFGEGTARLVETAPGAWTIRFEGFSVRNGPDLFVYVSPDPTGYADGAIEIAPLRATDGSFNTPVPAGIDLADAGSILIWCKQFSTLFAVATLDA